MNEEDELVNVFDDLSLDLNFNNLPVNKRMAIRYRRKDIKAIVRVRKLFLHKGVNVILHDISSRGAGVLSPEKIPLKGKVSLHLLFNDGKRFVIDAKVVYSLQSNLYGLKFTKVNNDLAEYLLQTQTDLTFN